MLLVEQKLVTLPEHMHSPVFSEFLLLKLKLSVYCFVDRWFVT